jgi:hypothetical protein
VILGRVKDSEIKPVTSPSNAKQLQCCCSVVASEK